MGKLLVHIEGVNFEATISDVNDLATQRGASLALLHAPKALILAAAKKLCATADEVFSGASTGHYLLNTDETTDKVEKLLRCIATTPPSSVGDLHNVLPHLCFSIAAVDACGNMAEARYSVIARARHAQLQAPTVVAPAPVSHKSLCALNPILPVGSPGGIYSASVHARREYGRRFKRMFYGDLDITLPCKTDEFAHSIEDLVREGPDGVPDNVRNKVAHIYLDGNDFTGIREGAIQGAEDPLAAERDFANVVSTRRQCLLKRLIGGLSQCRNMFVASEDRGSVERKNGRVFRWETLLWGGDEAAFVAPAWTLPKILPLLAEGLAGKWDFQGRKLTHKCGIFIADRKTPIALARRLAEALAESAKCAGSNTVQVMISESIEPPVDITGIDAAALSKYRESLYDTGCPKYFTLDFSNVGTLIGGLRKIQAMPGRLPRSQLYGILRGGDIDTAFRRSAATCRDVIESPIFGAGGPTLLPYQRVSELLDYFPLEMT